MKNSSHIECPRVETCDNRNKISSNGYMKKRLCSLSSLLSNYESTLMSQC